MAASLPVAIASDQGAIAVTGTFWQATQPVSGTVTANIGTSGSLALDASVAGLSLAQGAATAGQKAVLVEGAVTTGAPTYTTGNSNPLSLTTAGLLRVDGSGVTQPVSGTFWQATQPVSGTVTANAGTGNFTVVQATGTNLHAVIDTGSTTAVTQATGTNLHTVVDSGTITTVSTVTSVSSATLAAETTKVIGTVRNLGNAGAIFDGVITAAAAPANMIAVGGVFNTTLPTLTTGQSAAIQVSSKGIQFSQLHDGTTAVGVIAGTTALKTDLSSVAGTAMLTGNGATGAGSQRVTIASDNTAFAVNATLSAETTKVIGTVRALGNAGAIFDAATGAAVPANILYNGARAATANPTSATGGNAVGLMADKAGRLVTTAGHVRDLVGVQTTQIASSSAETTIVTAGGAGVFNDISSLVITNATATAVTVTIKDDTAGTTRAIYDLAASGGIVINFPVPLVQAVAAKPWTATLSSAAVTVNLNVVYVKNL